MEENVFATSRNGHELKDMYNPENNTLDIRSNGLYPSNVLSNLCSNGFRFDGMICGSMEGFLQSLKQKNPDRQRQICSMKGGNARKHSVTSWQTDQTVWWKGRAINRQSQEYAVLVRNAYQAMFDQSERFRTALMQTRGIKLVHSSGHDDPFKTILTPTEFCSILEDMRDAYDDCLAEGLKPIVSDLGTNSREGANFHCYGISQLALIDKALVVRINTVLQNADNAGKILDFLSSGLKLEHVRKVNDHEQEIILNPQSMMDPSSDYILATDFSGEYRINFLSEDRCGNRMQIGTFDYIKK